MADMSALANHCRRRTFQFRMKDASDRAFAKWLIAVGVLAGIAVVIALFDWNWLRRPVAGYLSATTHRTVVIDGDLRVHLLGGPRLEVNAVSFGNAPWSAERVMAQAERVSVRLDAASLWHRPVALTEVTLVKPRVTLEEDDQGRANWDFGGGGAPLRVNALTIEDGVFHYRSAPAQTDVTINVTSSRPAPSGEIPIHFSGSGRLRDNPFTLQGDGASLLAFENNERPYRLDVRAQAGATSAHFDGTVVPARIDDVDGALTLEGRDLSQLYPIIPVPLPWTPAYRLTGQLAHQSSLWYFRAFKGNVGDSDLAGDFSLDRGRPRPLINADVVSTRLDYKDLGGFVGLPPPNQPPGAKPVAQKKEAAKRAVSERALPTKPYDLERLRAVDAKVHVKGERFVTTDLPLDHMVAALDLQDGVLKLEPLDFGIAGGHLVSHLVLDARQNVIRTRADVSIRDIELKDVVPALKPPNGSAGKLAGRAVFVASGNSVADMLGSSDGEAALISRGGDASALSIVLTNLDLARAVPLLMKGDERSPIRCVVTDLVADNGKLSSQSMVVDTEAEKIFGEGTIDFKSERYDLRLKAQSKHASLVALRGPIVIGGTFKSPQIRPAAGPIAARVGSAVALGVLAPPAALVPLIDFGGARDADCDGLMAAAMQNVQHRSAESTVVATK
jgi:uncharacterized protein involved in outer membrane biogenesis